MKDGTFIYSPDIRAIVKTEKGVFDLGPDIESFNLTRRSSALSTFTCQINNKSKKYDRKIPRMSRIVILLKRMYWLQVFSGYVTSAPFETVVPGTVTVSATCTLKRLEHSFWDPYSAAGQLLMPGANGLDIGEASKIEDGGTAKTLYRLLTAVAGWDSDKIHIQKIPMDFLRFLDQLRSEAEERNMEFMNQFGHLLGGNGIVGGVDVGAPAGSVRPFVGPLRYPLPASRGKISYFAGVGTTDATGNMALTGEPGTNPTDIWYCAMRWTPKGDTACYNFWKTQKLLVTNVNHPQYQVVLRPADWGPAGWAGRVIDVSPQAMQNHLRCNTDDEVTIQVVHPDTPLGPVRAAGAGPVATPEPRFQAASGVRFSGKGGMSGNTAAAMDFVKSAWNIPYGVWGPGPRSGPSDHGRGYAIDVGVSKGGTAAQGQEKALGTAIALWFAANPEVFGTKYVIWYNRIISRSRASEGWRPYTHYSGQRNPTVNHEDHVHISFEDMHKGYSSSGPPGNGWSTQGATYFGVAGPSPSTGGIIDETGSGGSGESPFGFWNREPTPTDESQFFYGDRAWLNDEKLLLTAQYVAKASLREFQSAPNGDFVAFFPDWFGIYGKTPTLKLRDIEIKNFAITVNDDPIVTHVGVAGAVLDPGTNVTIDDWMGSYGIISIENEAVIKLLLGHDPNSKSTIDTSKFLDRFGIRPRREAIPAISNHEWELLYSIFVFMKQWTAQYSTPLQMTFMPELYPGMRIDLIDHNIQLYVESVTHSGSRSSGFTTTATVTAPTRGGKPIGVGSDEELITVRPNLDPLGLFPWLNTFGEGRA